jgi:peptidoglycan/xylan/chitin deacetylase (PgdA/CDA1 family)
MRVVSPVLKRIVYPVLSKSGYLRRKALSPPVVVTYHGILPQGYKPHSLALDGHLVTAELFRRHMRLLQSDYNLISPQQFFSYLHGNTECPPRSVLLTGDDGLVNVLTDMSPIIRELELPSLFFLTGASASEQGSMLWYEKLYLWVEQGEGHACLQLPDSLEPLIVSSGRADAQWRSLIRIFSRFAQDQREQLLCELRTQLGISESWESEYAQNEILRRRFFVLNAAETRELATAGVTIGAHTMSHPMLSNMSPEAAYTEMAESRVRLEAAAGVPVWAIAYPFGDREAVGPRESEIAKRAGFQCGFVNSEMHTSIDERFMVPRVHISSEMTRTELDAHLSGFYRRLRAMV